MRIVSFERGFVTHPAGSCLAAFGETKVICTATIEETVPPFLVGSGSGWVTAEYAMLPGSTGGGRKRRDLIKRDGRGVEISRLIGRSLRGAVDLKTLGEISITIDCDVLQADGGTRTAAISGGWVALYDALSQLAVTQNNSGAQHYLLGQVGAVSVGLVDGVVVCDLDYEKDRRATVDMNIVRRDDKLVEIQGTGEGGTFDRASLDAMLDAADEGFAAIFAAQRQSLALGVD
jgi:ribonuclease PH